MGARVLPVLGLALLLAAAPRPADAHGVGQRYDLPVPLWLYLYGAAAAVILSFVLIGLFAGERREERGYPHFDLARIPWLHAVVTSAVPATALRVVSVALFALTLAAGLFGGQSVTQNFAPTFVWVVWWIGFGFFVALVANLWPVVNPWKILFDAADALSRRIRGGAGLELHEPYPAWLGVWPALALYGAFVWLENVYAGAPEPRTLGVAILAYSGFTWMGMAVYGRDIWLRSGEAFTVLFAVLGRFAPTETRVTKRDVCAECSDETCRERPECVGCEECLEWAPREARTVALRPWGAGLLAPAPVQPGRVAFVVFMLAAVTFDGLSVTPAWQELHFAVQPLLARLTGGTLVLFQSAGLVMVPLAFLLIYRSAIRLTGIERLERLAGVTKPRSVTGAFVHSLVPIAVVYQIAHYATLLVAQGWVILPLLSDPFASDWDLFGTASWSVEIVLSAALVWYVQVGLIVLGHAVAVYLAHTVASGMVRQRSATLRSQIPLLVLMVAYTISSLWILSQGVVS